MPTPLRPLCFVAMPFGKKRLRPHGPLVDFDAVFASIRRGVEQARLECLRADLDPSGGFIHRSMYEALVVAELVVADLTASNANVLYEVGVRHGVGQRNTLLVCATDWLAELPFDARPWRVLPYDRAALPNNAAAPDAFADAVAARLRKMAAGEVPDDNPIVQVTGLSRTPSHEKTDLFVKRLEAVGEFGDKVRAALRLPAPEAVAHLDALRDELLAPNLVRQLHTSLLAVYLGYREKKAWLRMVDLARDSRLPRELRSATVVLEQLALAQNRLAEASDDRADETRWRDEALATLQSIPTAEVSSETWGIRGRIHKGHYDLATTRGEDDLATGALTLAIEAYEKGVQADPRDYFPGVNAITLRLSRGRPEDEKALASLLPIVRFAIDRLAEPATDDERYWRTASRLEVAAAERDWASTSATTARLLALRAAPWMRETTVKNLQIQKRARAGEAATVAALDRSIDALTPRP